MAVARDSSGKLVLILRDQGKGGKVYVGTENGLTPLPTGDVTLGRSGQPPSAKGYTLAEGRRAVRARPGAARTSRSRRRATARSSRRALEVAVELAPTLRYDPKTEHVRAASATARSSRTTGAGSFADGKDELQPGWKTYVGFRNFSKMIHDPLIRKPFLSVFAWTFVFAASVVLFSFAIGLFLAITLDKNGPPLPEALPLGAGHPVRDSRLPRRCSSGRAS